MDAVKPKMGATEKRYNSALPNFRLAGTLAGNVKAFREAMRPLGGEIADAELSRWIRERHRQPDLKGLSRQRVALWDDGAEPDLYSVWLMAQKAGVTMEEFCGFGDDGATDGAAEEPPPGTPPEVTTLDPSPPESGGGKRAAVAGERPPGRTRQASPKGGPAAHGRRPPKR